MPYDLPNRKPTMDEAISRLGGSQLASPNRYWVSFSLPEGITKRDKNDNLDGVAVLAQQPRPITAEVGDIGFYCTQMSFPGRSFQTVDSRHIGTPFRLPFSTQYTDVNFTFNLSADLRERKYFEVWQQMITNVHMNSMNFYKEYVMPVHLMQLDKEGNVTYQVTLVEAFPIALDEVNNSFAAQNEVSQCSVTMAYRHWINQDILTVNQQNQ